MIVSDFRSLSVILVSSLPLMEKDVPHGKEKAKKRKRRTEHTAIKPEKRERICIYCIYSNIKK